MDNEQDESERDMWRPPPARSFRERLAEARARIAEAENKERRTG